jgi:hypothetical protein
MTFFWLGACQSYTVLLNIFEKVNIMKLYIFIVVFFSFFCTSPSHAWHQRYPSSVYSGGAKYAAIAYNPYEDRVGYSYGYRTLFAAKDNALLKCGYDCEIKVWTKNGCAALAVGYSGRGWSRGRNKYQAKQGAMRHCQSYTSNCRVRSYACSG